MAMLTALLSQDIFQNLPARERAMLATVITPELVDQLNPEEIEVLSKVMDAEIMDSDRIRTLLREKMAPYLNSMKRFEGKAIDLSEMEGSGKQKPQPKKPGRDA